MANLDFYDTHCCALEEIDKLASFEGDPKGAMISFCRSNLGKPVEWKIRQPSGDFGAAGALYSFYFFTASVYKGKTSYGEAFAKFIEENKLGKTITTPIMTNMAFHTDHGNQVWIWMPDVQALNAWWKVNQPVRAKKDKVA
jgi:hypothetical protein